MNDAAAAWEEEQTILTQYGFLESCNISSTASSAFVSGRHLFFLVIFSNLFSLKRKHFFYKGISLEMQCVGSALEVVSLATMGEGGQCVGNLLAHELDLVVHT